MDLKELIALTANSYIEKELYDKIMLFLSYLQEACLTDNTILSLYENTYLTHYNQLPESLWEGSILKPYTYYYHTKLRQISSPCRFDSKTFAFKKERYFNEMRIFLTYSDVIADMYTTLHTELAFQNFKRDREALRYILEKYPTSRIGDFKMQTIDVIYMLFDTLSKRSYATRLNFLDLFNGYYRESLETIESLKFVPQKKFVIRTGEVVTCCGH